jgi:prefoldin subunit 5
VTETFSRRSKKEVEELRDRYDVLEDKYENLQSEHDRMRDESEERTNVRISNIEVEIESVNKRVEKLATDSYAIHSEVRDIHQSVSEMQVALRDIVQLYKAILTRYGFGNLDTDATAQQAAKQAATRNGDPGDHIIDALKREQETKQKSATMRASPPSKGRSTPPRASSGPPSTPPRASSVPSTTNALDELHRLSGGQRAAARDEPEALAERLASRSSHDDRVDRVARRDMGRMETMDRDTEGEFTRSLPKKSVTPKEPARGGDWEATAPPSGVEQPKKARKAKPRLEDLLSPE